MNSNRKGKEGERELANLLKDRYGCLLYTSYNHFPLWIRREDRLPYLALLFHLSSVLCIESSDTEEGFPSRVKETMNPERYQMVL